jgi:hypothetical protein
VRAHTAVQLLETTDLKVEAVARDIGYGGKKDSLSPPAGQVRGDSARHSEARRRRFVSRRLDAAAGVPRCDMIGWQCSVLRHRQICPPACSTVHA